MRLVRRIFFTFSLLLVATAVWGGYYAQNKGFSRTWREMVEAEFAKRDYYVDIGRLTLGPFQGLVAEDVRFFQDPQRRKELAFVDNVILDLDLTDVLKRDLSVNTLDVKDANLTLPLTPGRRDSELLRVDRFSARLVVTDNQIEVVRAEAAVAGVDVSLKGTLYRPPRHVSPAQGQATEEELQAQKRQLLDIRRRLDRVQQVLAEVERFTFSPDSPPLLEVEFAGDLADLAHLHADARLSAVSFHRNAYGVQSLNVSAVYDGARGRAVLRELHLRDGAGDLRLRGEWPLEDRRIDFEVESSADLAGLVGAFWPDPRLGEVVFFSPPRLDAEGSIRVDELLRPAWPRLPLDATGELRCQRFGSRGVVFDGLEAQFAVSGERVYARNLRLDHKSGVMLANFMYDPELGDKAFRYQTEMKLDPLIFVPFFDAGEAKRFVSGWQFNEASTVYIAGLGEGPQLDPASWSSAGVIDLRRFRLGGVPFEHLAAEYEGEGGIQHFRQLEVERPEGSLSAEELIHDSGSQSWEVRGLRSNLNVSDLVKAAAPRLTAAIQGYRFSHPPEVAAEGRIDASVGGEDSDFTLRIESDSTAEFEFLGRPLPVVQPSGTIRIRGARWQVADFYAELFGGEVTAQFDGGAPGSRAAYTASIGAEGIRFDDLLQLYGNSERRGGGTWSGEVRFSGQMGDPRSVSGEGKAELREGNLLAMPIFAPVADLAAKIPKISIAGGTEPPVPRVEEASATLKLAQGALSTEDLAAKTGSFRLSGAGTFDWLARSFSSALEVQVAGLAGPRLSVAGSGSVAAPQWRPASAGAP